MFLDFGNRGTSCPIMLATDAVDGGSRQRRVGGGHLGAVRDSVNAFLNFYFKKATEPQKTAISSASCPYEMGPWIEFSTPH